MNGQADRGLTHHPAPARHRVGLFALFFGLIVGPGVWELQVCLGAALSGRASYLPVLWSVLVFTVVLALVALVVALGNYRRSRGEQSGEHGSLLEIGAGRTRFLSAWGVLFSGGFAIFAAANLLAVIVLRSVGQ